MHEDLLGYLFGALSADEQRRVEDALAADPQLRAELERIRGSLEPLDELSEPVDPPAGLAQRTLDSIAQFELSHRPTPRSLQPQDAPLHPRRCSRAGAAPDKGSSQHRLYNMADGLVLALVALTAITILMPALVNSRYESRKVACQNNLRIVSLALIQDSLRHANRFLEVPESGNRAFDGIFAPILVDRQLLPVNTTALLCPGVGPRGEVVSWRVPTLAEIDAARELELQRLRAMAGGNYSFAVGYTDQQNRYLPIVNTSRPYFPILADAPNVHLESSANHGGRGQNFVYEDGHITFVMRLDELNQDDPWRNYQGLAEAGNGQNDAVLLRSESPPFCSGDASPDVGQ